MTGSTSSAEYIYDAFGRRVAKVVDGVTTYYLYNKRYQVLEERDGTDALAARYLYASYIDEPLTMERSGVTYTYHPDAQFSLTEMTDSNGALVERYEYDVYGEARLFDGAGNSLTTSAIGNPYLYTGRRYDPESGNYYYRARIYSAGIGRFLQMDPTGYVDGMNLYASYFVVNGGDPNGTDFIAVGTRKLQGFEDTWEWLPFNHMSLEYYTQDKCEDNSKEGERFTANREPEGAIRSGQLELLMNDETFGHEKEDSSELWGDYAFWVWDQISVINRTSTAQKMIIIYADTKSSKGAKIKWQAIKRAARNYRFAEQLPLGTTLKNWPNSKYNTPFYVPLHNRRNNSNTFVREMANEIGEDADIIGGWHPGADKARPVLKQGYTPTRR
jgi:RHS repeat-associated protein